MNWVRNYLIRKLRAVPIESLKELHRNMLTGERYAEKQARICSENPFYFDGKAKAFQTASRFVRDEIRVWEQRVKGHCE